MADSFSQKKITIGDMQELAHQRSGMCLSGKYLGTDTKLKWKCADGHIWEARPSKIKKGTWCPFCAGRAPKDLDHLHTLAQQHGGVCLSQHYDSMNRHALWKCQFGHEWSARPANIQNGNWCPFCAGRRQTIDDMRVLARQRGGTCLATEYRGQAQKLKWQCQDGHNWEATPNSIKNGSWCPHCNINYGEEVCRLYFEAIFDKPFPKARPLFLKTGTRGVMELDGYCEELRLAFEHHGLQHYEHVGQFHKNPFSFKSQQYRDQRKRALCDGVGVR